MANFDDGAQDALNKMARACKRGTGCHLTREEIQSLNLTTIGELWAQDDPRMASPTTSQQNKGDGNADQA